MIFCVRQWTPGTDLGHQAQRFMSAGELVPDHLIIEMVKEKLTALPTGTGVLFDGFPRTEAQASAFSMMLGALGLAITGRRSGGERRSAHRQNRRSPILPLVWVRLQYGPRSASAGGRV